VDDFSVLKGEKLGLIRAPVLGAFHRTPANNSFSLNLPAG
jgi:hypothetical protein